MFTKKEKIEMTEAEKEQKELEKQAKKLRRKEGAIKFAKNTGLVAAGFIAGAGSAYAYQKFSENKSKETTDSFEELNDEIGDVFAEDNSEVA